MFLDNPCSCMGRPRKSTPHALQAMTSGSNINSSDSSQYVRAYGWLRSMYHISRLLPACRAEVYRNVSISQAGINELNDADWQH